jgi:hypothetical protein
MRSQVVNIKLKRNSELVRHALNGIALCSTITHLFLKAISNCNDIDSVV